MKRFLVFALLLLLGFAALRIATGGESPATAGSARQDTPPPERPSGEPVLRRADGTEVSIRGGFTLAPRRPVPRADGSVELQPLYELTCRDSEPVDAGRHRLDGVAMKLFDQGKHVADLTAALAFVELQTDAQHQRQLRSNRAIDLEDATVVSVAGSRLPPVRLAIARLRANIDDEQIVLTTPDDDTAVRVDVEGDRPAQITGHGLTARMPRDKNSALGRFDLLLRRDPEVTMAGVAMHAKGQLHYVEELDSGAALLTAEDDVRVDLANGRFAMAGERHAGGTIAVRGDRLHGWLQRTRRDGGEAGSVAWTLLRLFGSRATVHTDELDLLSPRLTVVPGPDGDIAAITADSGASELHQRLNGDATFASPRPIHLVRTGASIAAVHRLFGFPAFTLGSLAKYEIVAFEGAAAVDAGDGVHVEATDGLHLVRSTAAAAAGDLIAHGRGRVHITRGAGDDRVDATGDHGFTLWRTPRGDDIVLGVNDPAAEQAFSLERGPVRLAGSGSAHIVRAPDGAVQLRLASDRAAIGGTFRAEGDGGDGTLRSARSLAVDLRNGAIENLQAEGEAVALEFARGNDRLHATGRRIVQLAANSWRIEGPTGAPARIELPATADGSAGELTAPVIDVHRVAPRALLLDATGDGDTPARVTARTQARGAPAPTQVSSAARRVRLLPFAVGPGQLAGSLLGLDGPLAAVVGRSMSSPWILADDEVVVDVDDPVHGRLHGNGARMVASQGARSMLLHGDGPRNLPAEVVRSENGETTGIARGARIRVHDRDGPCIAVLPTYAGESRLVPPTVDFRAAPRVDANARPGWMRGECRGEIELLPEAVLFHGPVTANSLRDDGTDDPDGMHITAQHLQIDRRREDGRPLRFVAGTVTLDWRTLHVRSRNVELDLAWDRCIAEDPDGAVVRFGDNLTYTAPRLEANYATYAVRSYRGAFVHGTDAPDR